MIDNQEDLVKEMASFGADIPTTPMFWKKETNRLQWIVRQMSWIPPWVTDKNSPAVDSAADKSIASAPHRYAH